jgi:transcriptional regulator with XRE-family HTH domain
MDKSVFGNRIKELRNKRGMSQEFLAEESGLSLRTIQRVEKGESNPTGDSLKKLANALNVNPDELIDWTIKEDRKYLNYLNMSALTFLFFPILGILIPFILWIPKKGKVQHLDQIAKSLINFQITWTMLLCLTPVVLYVISKIELIENITHRSLIISIVILYVFNLMSILVNSARIIKGKKALYFPQLKLL